MGNKWNFYFLVALHENLGDGHRKQLPDQNILSRTLFMVSNERYLLWAVFGNLQAHSVICLDNADNVNWKQFENVEKNIIFFHYFMYRGKFFLVNQIFFLWYVNTDQKKLKCENFIFLT